jgi:PAS domain S-box-containing protein
MGYIYHLGDRETTSQLSSFSVVQIISFFVCVTVAFIAGAVFSKFVRRQMSTKVPLKDNDVKVTGIVGVGTDITKRKLAEEQIENIFNMTGYMICVAGIDGYFKRINDSFGETLGYSREELLAKPFLEFIHPADKQKTIDVMKEKLTQGEQVIDFENRYRCKDGSYKWLSWASKPVAEEGVLYAIAYDVTERKQAEDAVHSIFKGMAKVTGEDYFKSLAKYLTKASGYKYVLLGELTSIHEDRIKTHVVWTGEGFAENFEYDLAGSPCENVVGQSFCVYTDNVQEQFPEDRLLSVMGARSYCGIPLFNSEGKALGILAMLDDEPMEKVVLTESILKIFATRAAVELERINAERESKNLAKFPSENPNPVMRFDNGGMILYANEAGDKLLKTWNCLPLELAPEEYRTYIKEAIESKRNREIEVSCQDRFYSLIIAPVSGTGYVNIYGVDITERRKVEEELEEHHELLEKLVHRRTEELQKSNESLIKQIEHCRELEKQILTISEQEQRRIGEELHDSLGQQLTGIAFMTQVLTQRLSKRLPEEREEFERIAKLVNQTVETTRGLARGLHPVDLNAGILESAFSELAENTVTLFDVNCRLDRQAPLQIDDDEAAVQLYRIAQEAITNAIKHGKTKNIEIILDCNGQDRSTMIIESDGLDFPDKHEPTDKGIGLRIMEHRVDLIGGSLNIGKRRKGGTLVVCDFPNKNACLKTELSNDQSEI